MAMDLTIINTVQLAYGAKYKGKSYKQTLEYIERLEF